MKTNWPVKKLRGKKRDNVYYLIRDILSCFPDNFEGRFLGVVNHHLIAKEATRQILMDEVKKPKPQFRILAGALILQNYFLRQMQRAAIYEVFGVVGALKYCFLSSSFKTIKKLSAQVILRLFATLYFEYIIMPGRKEEGKSYLDQFRKHLSVEDITNAMNLDDVFPRFIFENHGIELGFGTEANIRLREMLNKFYPSKESSLKHHEVYLY